MRFRVFVRDGIEAELDRHLSFFAASQVIASLYRDVMHLVVRADSPIQSVADLKGKRVALGEPGSGSLVTAQTVLKAVTNRGQPESPAERLLDTDPWAELLGEK